MLRRSRCRFGRTSRSSQRPAPDEPFGFGISHQRQEEVNMKRTLSAALVVALVLGAIPVGAQQQFAAAPSVVVSASAGDGPITRAALREGVLLGLTSSTEQQETQPADAVSALREAARAIPVGKRVKVRMRSGDKHDGTLLAAGETEVKVAQWDDHILELRYDTMRSIELDTSMGRGQKALLITIVSVIGGIALFHYFSVREHGG
jgi:hypothetical protein